MGLFSWLEDGQIKGYKDPVSGGDQDKKLTGNLLEDIIEVRRQCGNSADVIVREMQVDGIQTALIGCEGMFSTTAVIEGIVDPLLTFHPLTPEPEILLRWIRQKSVMAPEQKEFYTFGELFNAIMSGFVVILIDTLPLGIALGLQGINVRSIGEPSGEMNVKGSREGFVESLQVNISMVRRRAKSPALCFEPMKIGSRSNTSACLAYFSDVASDKLLEKIRYQLSRITMEVVLDTGQIQPFLEGGPLSIFSGTHTTERPDTLVAKLAEGRVGLLLDGTPFVIIIPFLMVEHFQSLDDYLHRPYYAIFARFLKYVSFLIATLLPGLYVTAVKFHPEMLPKLLLFRVAAASQSTPFPILFEMLLIQFLYEVLREAGLRMPRPVGGAVSIVGGLVIGDAAVRAGIVGIPIIIVVALTVISAFVLPSLYDSITFLRFAFIILGGVWGVYGLTLGIAVAFVNMCAVETLGIPLTVTSSPLSLYGLRDTFLRLGWRQLQKKRMVVDELPGSDIHPGGRASDA